MPNLPEDIIDRLKGLESRRASWEDTWQDVLDFVLPQRTPVRTRGIASKGERRSERQYDSTATRFMRRLASTLVGLIVNEAERWVAPRIKVFEGQQEVEEWLDFTATKYFEALNRSNFYAEIPETFADAITIGTASMRLEERKITEPGFNGFIFMNQPAGEFFIDENDQGELDTFFRCIPMNARQFKMAFPEHSLKGMEDAIQSRNIEKEWEIIHAVFRSGDPYFMDAGKGNQPWRSIYVAREDEKVVSQGGFFHQRHFAMRWSKASGEIYGRGPAMEALSDIKTLNTLTRYALEGLVMSVYPPWLFPDESIIGRLKVSPGATNFYDPEVQGEIRALESRGQFRVELQKEANLQEAIAAAFLDDILGLRDEAGDVTATEVLDRRERRQQITNPAVSRIITELLSPMVKSSWMMMLEAGEFGQPPAILGTFEDIGRSVEFTFLSALARAQKLVNARSLSDALTILGPLLQIDPSMLQNYDRDRIARDVPIDAGVPAKWLVDERVVAQQRQAAAEQQQAQAQAAMGLQMAETGAKVDKDTASAEALRAA